MSLLKRAGIYLLDLFTGDDDPAEPQYDPAHIGAMIIIVLTALSVLFWLLWALLVCGGGIQAKVVPFLRVLFTGATAHDFGYAGYPYQMGVFEGWIVNAAALLLSVLLCAALWYVFTTPNRFEKQNNHIETRK